MFSWARNLTNMTKSNVCFHHRWGEYKLLVGDVGAGEWTPEPHLHLFDEKNDIFDEEFVNEMELPEIQSSKITQRKPYKTIKNILQTTLDEKTLLQQAAEYFTKLMYEMAAIFYSQPNRSSRHKNSENRLGEKKIRKMSLKRRDLKIRDIKSVDDIINSNLTIRLFNIDGMSQIITMI